MNDARRRRIRKLTSDLHEGIQYSDRGDVMQECIEALESAVNSCEDADMNYVFDDIQSMLETCEAEL